MTTVAILCVRHPDASNEFTVSAPGDVLIIDVDLGSSFDSYPKNADEAESAVEIADSIVEQASILPDGDQVKGAVEAIAEELLGYAEEYVDIDEVREDIKASAARLAEYARTH